MSVIPHPTIDGAELRRHLIARGVIRPGAQRPTLGRSTSSGDGSPSPLRWITETPTLRLDDTGRSVAAGRIAKGGFDSEQFD